MTDDRASRCASELWRFSQNEFMDYELDGSGDCGPLIARAHQVSKLAILERHGFTPATWSALLDERLGGGYGNYLLRLEIEVEPMDEWLDNNTFVCTLGYPGHPGAEYSSIAYLKGGES